MLKLFFLFLGCAAVATPAFSAGAVSSAPAERAAAAFALAFGRVPAPDDLRAPAGEAAGSIAELIAQHRRRIAGDAALQRLVVSAAVRDALGRAPNAEELSAVASGGFDYAALVQRHVAQLAAHPDQYAAVVDRAYRRVLGRAAEAVEFDYWKRRPAVSFVLLVGCIENWAQRNSPGLTLTSGTASLGANSAWLSALRLPPGVAAEARAALGLPALWERPLAAELGCHVVAPGAAELGSVGAVHFLAVGDARLLTGAATAE